jgi:hypothetical protein
MVRRREGLFTSNPHRMEFEYETYPEQRMIVTRYRGAFTFATLIECSEKLWADQRYRPEYDGVVDLTDGKLTIGRQDFRAVIDFVRREDRASRGRWAAVANSPFATACSLLFQRAIEDRHPFGVFSTFEAAGTFLGMSFADAPLLSGVAPRRV